MNVRQLVLEYATPRAGELAVIGRALGDREIGLGCVNPRTDEAETPESIVARADEALQFWTPEQIFLNPDCGFACFANRCVNDGSCGHQTNSVPWPLRPGSCGGNTIEFGGCAESDLPFLYRNTSILAGPHPSLRPATTQGVFDRNWQPLRPFGRYSPTVQASPPPPGPTSSTCRSPKSNAQSCACWMRNS